MPRSFRLSRRHVLRGLVGGGLASVFLPPLEAMLDATGSAYACDGILPVRFGLFFWGNGNIPDLWTPETDGEDYELSEELLPLASMKSKLAVVTGLSVKTPNDVPHGSGSAGVLSGYALRVEDEAFVAPTIDQVIANEIGGDTIYRSVQTSPSGGSGQSYNGPNSLNPAETDPWAFYERLFGATFREPGEEGIVDPSLGLRRSVLDAVMDDLGSLEAQVSASDKVRLDQHMTGIRELEQRLARLEEDPPNLEACERPLEPDADYPDIDGRPQVSAKSRVFCDMLAMGLACDQTRVFGHYFSDPVSGILYPGASAGHHDLTHNETGDQPEVHAITVQVMEEFAYLLEALDAVEEGDGTLLDHCVVLGTSEVSLGKTHSLDEMPTLVAGGNCGAIQTGMHYRSLGGDNVAKLSLSLIRACGINQTSFGDGDAYTEDGLSGVEG